MTTDIELTALDGTNPLAYLAALGTLHTLHRAGRQPTLRWTDDLTPTPHITGATDLDDLLTLLDNDRTRWTTSPTLTGPGPHPLTDAKPTPDLFPRWAAAIAHTLDYTRDDADLFTALLAEGALDGNGNGKPTHLHFTAGQQKFLTMVRELAANVDYGRLHEALIGPWQHDSTLPTLSWNSHGDRLYAHRATNPGTDKKHGIPGADWLAVHGLVFHPTALTTTPAGKHTLKTSGCDTDWKTSALRWPLWTIPLDRDTTWSLVTDRTLIGEPRSSPTTPRDRTRTIHELRTRGINRILQAPIRRNAQGGYGSLGASTPLYETT